MFCKSRIAAVTVGIVSLLFLSVSPGTSAQQVDETFLPTGQRLQPAGQLLSVDGRPNDLVLDPKGRWLFVKSHKTLQIIQRDSFQLTQELPVPGGSSLTGILVADDGHIYVSSAGDHVAVFAPVAPQQNAEGDPPYQHETNLALPEASFPCGMCFDDQQESLWVCLSKKNQVVKLNRTSGEILRTYDTGVSPFSVVIQQQQIYVSNLGGRRANEDDTTATSAGTEAVVDQRGIASTGTIMVIDPEGLATEVPVPLHPTALLPLGERQVLVANSNDDSVSTLVGSEVKQRVITKPLEDLPFGSMPNSLCLSSQQQVMVGLAGNNAVAVYQAADWAEGDATPLGLIPTAWYPAALACDDQYLYIANLKGVGARASKRPIEKGRNSHDHLGAIQRVRLRELQGGAFEEMTKTVRQQAALLPTRRVQLGPQLQATPVPVPAELGQPSVFQHVIYVIKENRTYDQVFGDLREGRGEPRLCTFPEKITPNHHALAKRFGLLDNYYCNGVLSADGHSWATEGNVTPYLERAFGGFARSYTFGDDPLTYSSSGFVWDHVLSAGLSFRNYGEMDYAKPPAGMGYQEIYQAYLDGQQTVFEQNIGIERLRRFSSRNYPGWNMQIPDVLRMDRFLNDFRKMKVDADLANLSIVYLPQDHLGGGVTSQAHMADNDQALGKLVHEVSRSPFWKNTLIVVNEDDPQNGFDHIDGHRSICLVISAYSKPGVNHQFYNQTSVLRTILHVLGLPPMNQNEARSPLMTACFQNAADSTPYELLPTEIPLNEKPQPAASQGATERRWRSILATVPIERTGMKTPEDEDHLNRFIWHETMGWNSPYPAEWAGGHGRGLKPLGLEVDETSEED